MIEPKEYIERHRKSSSDFIRQRKLPFVSLLKFLLQKSVKSLQLRLNEFTELLDYQISASALSQARQKLSHTAFIELHQKCVVDVMYCDGDYERYKGRRLLAIDGSTLRLPKSKEILQAYGQTHKESEQLVEGKLSVLYDMLNCIPLQAQLYPGRTNDIHASLDQLSLLTPSDIVVADRGYDSYGFFASIMGKKADFVVRCRSNRTICSELMQDKDCKEITKIIKKPKLVQRMIGELPEEITIRFIRIPLPNGEIEILATSLLDKSSFPYKEFKKIYAKRWRIETYFQILKSRLGLENFSGKTKEAVLQDLNSCIFVSGLATIITEEANEELANKDGNKFVQQVNNVVAFHAIKNKIITLMFDPPHNFQEQVKALFLQNPTLKRYGREKVRLFNSRTGSGKKRSLFYQKHLRKHVF